MIKRFGRTRRIRRRKVSRTSEKSDTEENFNLLYKWMRENGFMPVKKLKPKEFKDSGRGLMAKERIPKGDLVVSIPEKLLITPKNVLNSYLGYYFERFCPKSSGHQILSIFLMCERAKSKTSEWYPYINSLPQSYDIPAFSENYKHFRYVPSISLLATKQVDSVKQSYEQLKSLLKDLERSSPLFHGALDLELFKWAWCTVNTRCVYIDCFQANCTGKFCTFHLALVPYLDLLNHSPEVQVEAGFNSKNKQYEIRSSCDFKKYSQVFINYGPHNNRTLLIEYGFVVLNNCNDSITFSIDDITSAYQQCTFSLPLFSAKLEFILQNNLLENAVCSCDGLSWNLNIILKILVSSYHIKWWKSRLLDCSNILAEHEQKYVTLKRKLLSLKLNDYKINCIHEKSSSDKFFYLQKILLELFSMERLILIKALQ